MDKINQCFEQPSPVVVVEEAGENHRHGQATGKLYHLRL